MPMVIHTNPSLYMIKSCTKGTNKKDIEYCAKNITPHSTLEYVIPVIDSFSHVVYRNKYCARCNQVYNFTYLNIAVKCKNASKINQALTIDIKLLNSLDSCEFAVQNMNKSAIKECTQTVSCTDQHHKYYEICHAYNAPLIVGDTTYKNYHYFKASYLWDTVYERRDTCKKTKLLNLRIYCVLSHVHY